MAKTENVELTVLCLIQDGDKILLQNRVKKDWKGYTLPGGHVEGGTFCRCCEKGDEGRTRIGYNQSEAGRNKEAYRDYN